MLKAVWVKHWTRNTVNIVSPSFLTVNVKMEKETKTAKMFRPKIQSENISSDLRLLMRKIMSKDIRNIVTSPLTF